MAVPGLGLSVEVVRCTLDRLPARGTVVLLPAFGRRAPRNTPLSPERLAGLLLDDLSPTEPVVLIAHSASCQLVVEAAVRAPERVRAIVLVGPTTDPRAATWPGLVRRWLRTAVHEKPWQLPMLVRAYTRTGLVSMARGLDAARRHSLDSALAAVRCPVLIVRGRYDAICPTAWTAALAAAAPHGRSETLAVGAHMVPITHPAALAACVTAFLSSVRTG